MNNKKAEVLIEAANMAPHGLMVEIGSVRQAEEVPEDGYSTVHLARYAEVQGVTFRSYDNEQPTVDLANQILHSQGLGPVVVCQDGVQALTELGPVAFLYLDSHKDPQYSLDQFEAAELMPGAIVAIDDTHKYDGWDFGKATYLITLADGQEWSFDIVPTFESYYKTAMTIIQIPKEGKPRGQLTT